VVRTRAEPEILLLRHAESAANEAAQLCGRRCDPPLTALGHRQAIELAVWLSDIHTDWIVTSPARRARETAAVIASVTRAPIAESALLREVDLGKLDARTDPQAWSTYQEVSNAWLAGNRDVRMPGGESCLDASHRLTSFVKWAARQPGRTVAVTHGTFMWAALAMFHNAASPVLLRNCAAVAIRHGGMVTPHPENSDPRHMPYRAVLVRESVQVPQPVPAAARRGETQAPPHGAARNLPPAQ
jgi:broad specificity phosphatase PhoE